MVWLIYHQSECREEVISSIFLALQRRSLINDLQWTVLSARRVTFHLRDPAQLLGDLGTRLSVTKLNFMHALHLLYALLALLTSSGRKVRRPLRLDL